MSPVKYELGFCIPKDGILHSHRHENLVSCISKIKKLKYQTFVVSANVLCKGILWLVPVILESHRAQGARINDYLNFSHY
jgi:hypothetical protein